MKDKETRELILIITAMIAFAVDVIGIAVQIETLPLQLLRLYYIPVLAICLYHDAVADVKRQKAMIRHEIQQSRKASEQRFLEDYARFVSEVHSNESM